MDRHARSNLCSSPRRLSFNMFDVLVVALVVGATVAVANVSRILHQSLFGHMGDTASKTHAARVGEKLAQPCEQNVSIRSDR